MHTHVYRGLIVAIAVACLVFGTTAVMAQQQADTVVGGGSSAAPGSVDSKTQGPRFYQRSNYVWPFASGPYYGPTSADSGDRSRAGMVITRVGAIDTVHSAVPFPEELTTPIRFGQQGTQHFIVVLDPAAVRDGRLEQLRQSVEALGGRIIQKMPVASYLMRITSGAYDALSEDPSVISVFPYHAAIKIDPSVGRAPLTDPTQAVSEVYRLSVASFTSTNLDVLTQKIAAIGGVDFERRSGSLIFSLHRSKLADVAQIEQVKQVTEHHPFLIEGEETTSTMQAGTCGSASSPCLSPFHNAEITGGGRAVCGAGADVGEVCERDADCDGTCDRAGGVARQVIAILDSGVQVDASDLSNSITLSGWDSGAVPQNVVADHRKIKTYETSGQFGGRGDTQGCDSTLSGGSTHGHVVAAIAAGSGTDTFESYGGSTFLTDANDNNWKTDGVAPGSLIVVYDAQKTPAAGGSLCGSEITIGSLYDKECSLNSAVTCLADLDCNVCDSDNTPCPGGQGDCDAGPGGTCVDEGDCNATGGALRGGYGEDARIFNMSFGTAASNPGVYSALVSGAIDQFLIDFPDAMTFSSAGNAGGDSNMDGQPDQGNVGEPGLGKNGVSVGASGQTGAGLNGRAGFSSVGPATDSSKRIVPLVMAPGTDSIFGPGLFDPYSCRTNDNDQNDPVICTTDEQIVIEEGTSFSSPAVAGTAVLIRDYFAQGFYPDGVRKATDEEPVISGALVKALLIASAEFMTAIVNPGGALTEGGRFNAEQGYGRVELDNALPLSSWASSPPGIVVTDGSVKVCSNFPAEVCAVPADDCTDGAGSTCILAIDNTDFSGTANPVSDETYTFRVEDNTQSLKIVLAWIDQFATDQLQNDLDMTLTSPTNLVYHGNFFSEDVNLNDILDNETGPDNDENCIDGINGTGQADRLDEGAFSIPVNNCGPIATGDNNGPIDQPDRKDHKNPNEAIFLSPDPNGDSATCFIENRCRPGGDDPQTPGTDESLDNQIETGSWTLRILTAGSAAGQPYTVAMVGPVAVRSSVRFDLREYVCNDLATITVNETDGSPSGNNDTNFNACGNGGAGCDATVAGRVTVEVWPQGAVGVGSPLDRESGVDLGFAAIGTSRSYVASNVLLSDSTLRDEFSTWNNGTLDVRSGETLRVEYADEIAGSATADELRANEANSQCEVRLQFGGINIGQFGQNRATLVEGGCERDARGKFTFGFPDKYMDAGEYLGYRIAFTSAETAVTLDNAEISLSCVIADSNSPESCQPGQEPTVECSDPDRTDNVACTQLSILDSPKQVEAIPPGAILTANFAIVMAGSITGQPNVDMMLGVKARTAGKGVESFVASRHRLDRDEKSVFYSTDFPQSGIQLIDWDNDEVITTVSSCSANSACVEGDRGIPTTDLNFADDYRFEQWVWSNLESNPANDAIRAPWNFDLNDGGFTVFLHPDTDTEILAAGNAPAQFGEDFNGNGVLDEVCSGNNGGTIGCTADDQCGSCAEVGLCAPAVGDLTDFPCSFLTPGCNPGQGGCDDCQVVSNFAKCEPVSCTDSDDCGGTPCTANTQSECSADPGVSSGCAVDNDCLGQCDNSQIACTSFCSIGGAPCDNQTPCGGSEGTCVTPECDMNGDCDNFVTNTCNTGVQLETCEIGSEDRDPVDQQLNQNWSTDGGCGWQTKDAGQSTGGIWHTGRIDVTTLANCAVTGGTQGQCQLYETIGTTASNDKDLWFELLKTPIMSKVNQQVDNGLCSTAQTACTLDSDCDFPETCVGDARWTSEHLQWSWNLAMDMEDRTAAFSWELDLDTVDIVASNLDRLPVFNALFGEHGPASGGNAPLTGGFKVFSPTHVCDGSLDGSPVACSTDEQCDDWLLSGACAGTATFLCADDTSVTCTDAAVSPECGGGPPINATCALGGAACDDDFDCPPTSGIQGDPGDCQGGIGPCIETQLCTGSDFPCSADEECKCVQNPGATFGGIGARGDTVNGSSTPYAGFCMWAPGVSCSNNTACNHPGGSPDRGPCVIAGNRGGDNSCFFEGVRLSQTPLSMPGPPDNDLDDDFHCENVLDDHVFCNSNAGVGVNTDCGSCENNSDYFCRQDDGCGTCDGDGTTPCQILSDCTGQLVLGPCNLAAANTTCQTSLGTNECVADDTSGNIDEYVYPNGPVRNWDLTQVNGPDMRFGTLEDIYGDSGNTFQGALGFLNFQGTGNVLEPASGYGLGLDDMVVEWREFRLAKDETDCFAGTGTCDNNTNFNCNDAADCTAAGVGGACTTNPSGFYGGGTCASVETDTTQLYVGGAVLGISIVDPSPYDSTNAFNDCNNDGDFTDAGTCSTGAMAACGPGATDPCPGLGQGFCVGADDADCNDNGTDDIVATGTSESLDLEIIVLDEVTTAVYRAEITVSVTYDVPGTLFLSTSGTAQPTAEIRYLDRDDGTGNVCPNSADPAVEGLIQSFAAVAITQGDVIVTGSSLETTIRDDCDGSAFQGTVCTDVGVPTADCTRCGDDDQFPDTNEILNLFLDITNKSNSDFEDVVVRVLSSSTEIDCILQPFAALGTLPARGTAGACSTNTGTACTLPDQCPAFPNETCLGSSTSFGVGPFVFRVGNVNRSDPNEELTASIKVLISSKTFNALLRAQEIQFELDLNASGGGALTGFSEGFEGSLGQFTPDNVDSLPPNNDGSDGFRCQYNDPANPQGNSLDNPNCFLGFAGVANQNWWHFHGTGEQDGGKSHGGTGGMHFGKHGAATADDTMALKQLDGVVSDPINLGFGSPKLEMWHIVSVMDFRGSNTPFGETLDRAVVHVQLADPNAGNAAVGDWIKVAPFQNVYDVQGTNAFFNCQFDPIDDGNNEDSLFNPEDPTEINGPSSTCFPEFVFAAIGDSHPTRLFSEELTGRASDPEFAEGSSCADCGGTWLQSKFDLSRFRGRTVRLRYIVTTGEIEDAKDWIDAGFASGSLIDDGWYIDDVLVAEALASAPTLSVDGAANGNTPTCAGIGGCVSVSPVVSVSPAGDIGPGQVVEINASESSADQCADGTVHFRFFKDDNDDGLYTAGVDTLLRDFTDNPIIVDAPVVTTIYGVEVICTSDPSCPVATDVIGLSTVTVICPLTAPVVGGPFVPGGGSAEINFVSKTRVEWTTPQLVDVVRGRLDQLRAQGDFDGPVTGCLRENVVTDFFVHSANPTNPGDGFFYLVRQEDPQFCNSTDAYSQRISTEEGGLNAPLPKRDAEIFLDPSACRPRDTP